jgi:hypothetical protein
MQTRGNQFAGKSVPEIQLMLLKDMNIYFEQQMYRKIPNRFYNIYSPIGPEDADRKRFSRIFDQMAH